MLTLLFATGISSAADGPYDVPTGSQSPCEWLLAHRDAGTSLPDQVALAQANHELFTSGDLRCLKAAEVHKRVLQGARGEMPVEAVTGEAPIARVDVEFLGVIVAPVTRDFVKWDGIGGDNRISPELVKPVLMLATSPAIGALLDAARVDEMIAALATIGLQSTEAPDIFGYAEYRGPDAPQVWARARLSLRPPAAPGQDTCYTNFPGSPAFTGIKVDDGDVLRITLYDRDPLNADDPIGVFDLTRSDVEAALQHDGAGYVSVVERSQGGVLVLQIAVRAAQAPLPNVRGMFFRP